MCFQMTHTNRIILEGVLLELCPYISHRYIINPYLSMYNSLHFSYICTHMWRHATNGHMNGWGQGCSGEDKSSGFEEEHSWFNPWLYLILPKWHVGENVQAEKKINSWTHICLSTSQILVKVRDTVCKMLSIVLTVSLYKFTHTYT